MASKRTATQSIEEIRLQSRQAYLGKREELKLAELRQQVAEEAEEERRAREKGQPLSKRELQEFERHRITLRLAQERIATDDGFSGYHIPDADLSSKDVLLNKRHKDEVYKSEAAQWEDEVTARAKAAQVQKTVDRPEDYEFVFDPAQSLNWDKELPVVDPVKQMLESKLQEAEKRVKTIEETRKSLPMYKYREQLLAAVKDHQILLLSGETGSGKTTQVPQYLLEEGYAKDKMIAVTQPRRVAAISCAARIADETGTKLGTTVGYSIRFEQKVSDKTKIEFMTDGFLMRALMTDPSLSKYGVIMLDEAHERTIATDLLCGLLLDLLKYRDDLKIIVSSATLNAQALSSYFNDAPIFNVPGRTHPVSIFHSQQPESNYLSAAVTTVFQLHISQSKNDPEGAILVFLTGQEEIEQAAENIQETAKKLGSQIPELVVCPIYSTMPTDLQNKIFEPVPKGARKCILATNIAETSLTIDGIVYVIDSGYSKQTTYDSKLGIESLIITPCSRASANQRAGRAGRTKPGMAFRLYTAFSYYNELPESTPPEIQSTRLSSVVLLLKSIGIQDLINFNFPDPPSPNALISAIEELYMLAAIDDKGVLTKTGRLMAEFPLDPALSKAILAADQIGCVDEVISIVAMLGESAALFIRPKEKRLYADAARNRFTSKEGGDHLSLLNIWNAYVQSEYDPNWAKENFVQIRSLNRARDVREQLQKLCERVGLQPSSSGTDHVAIRKAFTAGFFGHAARLNRDGMSYRIIANGMTVFIHPSSVCSDAALRPRWALYDTLVATSKEYMRGVCSINPEWLTELAPHFHKQKDIDKLGGDKKMPKERIRPGPAAGAGAKA